MFKRYLIAVLLILSFLVSACQAQTATAPAPTQPPAAEEPTKPAAEAPTEAAKPAASAYSEAPALATMVTAGTLPPLDERLPETPFVVGPGTYMTTEQMPDWQPGKYGGTLRSAHSVANWSPDIFVMMDEPFLMAPKISDQGIVCNVCQEFKVSDDNTTFTFTLRKGLKWSDGEPVTTEDVQFAWEDIRNNDKLYPSGPDNQFRTGFSPDTNVGKLEILDDYSFKITFDGPYGSFLRALTIEGWVGYTIMLEPAHYLKQFHIKYTTLEKLKPELDALNLTDEWWQVFQAKRCQNWDMTNPKCVGYPALNPWIGVASGNPSLMSFERNPYYFKVDTQGQQPPTSTKSSPSR
jgi:peptide/nickel transport system substrate-binding protein